MSLNWEHLPIADCGEPLRPVAEAGLACAPAYFEMGLSTDPVLRLRAGVLRRLQAVQAALRPQGLQLLVLDGHRPRAVQQALYARHLAALRQAHPEWEEAWLHAQAARYVTPPDRPGRRVLPHLTGGAVDLTLADARGRALDMGTPFDDFTARSATLSQDVPPECRARRHLLLGEMSRQGFANYPEEWWHFGWGDPMSALLLGQPQAVYGEVE